MGFSPGAAGGSGGGGGGDGGDGVNGGAGGAGGGIGGDGGRDTQSCHPLSTMLTSDVQMIFPWAVMSSGPSDPQKL
eukprot:1979871-Pleurochrysis_carterae.AAC.1